MDVAYGTRSELQTRLEECLAFARRTVEGADPGHALWEVDLGQVSGYEKMMMEAGLLAYLIHRARLCPEPVHALASTIRANYDARSALCCILRQPRLAASLGTLLLVLDDFGLATRQELATLADAIASPFVDCSEHVPFRMMDRHWVLSLAGRDQLSSGVLLPLSTACRTTHPIYMSREDGYAITHAVMYATDFGASDAPVELRRDDIWQTIDAAVAWCVAAGDYDLLAELLLAQLLLRRRFSAYGVIAWRRTRETWDAFGFLPSPSLSARSFSAIDDPHEQRQYALHNMYHTMLVGGLLCAALLDPRVTAPEPPSYGRRYREPRAVADAVTGAADHLRVVLGVEPSAAREAINALNWVSDDSHVDELLRTLVVDGGSEGGAGSSMAIDASIILAAQDYDLVALASSLRRAASSRTVTRTVEVGAEFLARQSLVGGAIGAGWLETNGSEATRADRLASVRATAALANCLLELRQRLSAL